MANDNIRNIPKIQLARDTEKLTFQAMFHAQPKNEPNKAPKIHEKTDASNLHLFLSVT